MNKILLVEGNNKIESGSYIIDYNVKRTLSIEGNVNLYNYDYENNDLDITIFNKGTLKFFKVNVLNKDLNININLLDNSVLELNYLVINDGNNTVNLNINMLGNDSYAKIKLRVVNKTKRSDANIICNGFVEKKTRNNELLEDLRGLEVGEDIIKISPNMFIDTNEVLANHKVSIGFFDVNQIFYLMSKGLSEVLAKKLLLESFTCGFMPEIFKEKIKLEVMLDE